MFVLQQRLTFVVEEIDAIQCIGPTKVPFLMLRD